jgi:hypothetical protein
MSHLDIPVCLHGSLAAVERRWRGIVERALADGSWAQVLPTLECCRENERPGPLYIARGYTTPKAAKAAWRLDVVRQVPFDLSNQNNFERVEALIREGLAHTW